MVHRLVVSTMLWAKPMTHHWGYVAACLSAVTYSVSYALSKLLLADIPPPLLAGLLYLSSGLYLIFCRLLPKGLTRPLYASLGMDYVDFPSLRLKDLPALLLTSFFGAFAAPALFYYGLALSTASAASLTAVLELVFTLLLACLLFREKIRAGEAAGVALITLGVALMTPAIRSFGGLVVPEAGGSLLVVAACILWALDNNLCRVLALRGDVIEVAAFRALLGGAFLLAFSLGLARMPGTGLGTIAATILLGVTSLGNSLLLFFAGLRHIGAAKATSIFATNTVLGVVWSALLLNEPLETYHVVALFLVVSGIYILYRSRPSTL